MAPQKPRKTSAPDAASFDLDAFIESRRTLTRPVLFKRADDLTDRARALQRQAERLAANPDAERGIDEPSAEQIGALLEALDAERAERGTPVTVRETTDRERNDVAVDLIKAQRKAAKTREDDTPAETVVVDGIPLEYVVPMRRLALALVEPVFTAAQLWTIYTSSVTGEAAVNAMHDLAEEVRAVPSGPFSPVSSASPSTETSEPS